MNEMFTSVSPKRIGWEPYLYLVYLGFFFFQPFFDPSFGLVDWLATLGAVALFLPVYFWGFRQQGSSALLAVGAMTALGFGSVFFNTGGTVFFVYAGAVAACVGRPRLVFRAVLGILGVVALAFVLSPLPLSARLWTFMWAFLFVPMIAALNTFQAERERNNEKLLMAQEEIERLATVAERERIARDLHDLLGHTLSVITLKAELAAKLTPHDPARAAGEMRDVERISRDALSEVRSAVRGYRAQGLEGELVSARVMLETAQIAFDYYAEPLTLSPAQEATLSLALREAVTNVVRHSGGTRCAVRLRQEDGVQKGGAQEGIVLEVQDNGCGGDAPPGAGLMGMRERVGALGGRVTREGKGGTRLTVFLPAATPDASSEKGFGERALDKTRAPAPHTA